MVAGIRYSYRPQLSWGAILSGCALSLVLYLAFSVLGTALGTAAIDPMDKANPAGGLPMGAAIGFALASIICIFVGAFVAGRSAPAQGGLHGLMSWSVTTLVTTFLLASIVTGITGTAFGLLGSGVAAAGQGVAAVAPALASKADDELKKNDINIDWDSLDQQLKTLLRQSGKPVLDPNRLKGQAEHTADKASQDAQRSATHPQQADETLSQWFDRIRKQARLALDAADKQALVNIIAARTGKTKAEAQQIATRYEQTFKQAMAQYQKLKAQAETKAREAAADAARVTSQAAWVTLAVLILGALVGYGGGVAGYSRRPDPHDAYPAV